MLKNLYIKNFVLIHEMTLDLQAGLSAFIGETGAGKSIFIDALGILAADRSSSSFVAKGAEKAIVEGTFCLGQDAHALRIMREAGLDVNDETVFTREINSQGKSTVRIDRRIVTLGLMKDVLRDQIDIHGQQDTQYLLSASRHLRLLDSFAGLDKEVGEVGALYRAYAALVKEKEEVLAQRYGRVEKEEIEYQIREIEQAHLKAEEEEELREKEKQYKAVKNSFERLQAIVQLYDEQLDEPLYMLDRQIGGLDSGTELLQARDAVRESLSTLNAQIEFIRGTLDDMNMTEEDVNLLQERLYVIQKLKHKYAQPSIAALLSFQERKPDGGRWKTAKDILRRWRKKSGRRWLFIPRRPRPYPGGDKTPQRRLTKLSPVICGIYFCRMRGLKPPLRRASRRHTGAIGWSF